MIEIGAKFGKWIVLEPTEKFNKSKQRYYSCKCECGAIIDVIGQSLKRGKSNGCQRCANNSPSLVGRTFGKWQVLKESENKSKAGHIYFECKCECGVVKNIRAFELKTGLSTQCQKCQGKNSLPNLGCAICRCKYLAHQKNIEEIECDLLGFCPWCDKFCCMNCSIDPLIGCNKK
jgi:hypothetical protein